MEGLEFTLLWITNENVVNPKSLTGMNKEKAIGSVKWTKSILGKDYRCFFYDPEYVTIFNKDGSLNWKKINNLETQTKSECS